MHWTLVLFGCLLGLVSAELVILPEHMPKIMENLQFNDIRNLLKSSHYLSISKPLQERFNPAYLVKALKLGQLIHPDRNVWKINLATIKTKDTQVISLGLPLMPSSIEMRLSISEDNCNPEAFVLVDWSGSTNVQLDINRKLLGGEHISVQHIEDNCLATLMKDPVNFKHFAKAVKHISFEAPVAYTSQLAQFIDHFESGHLWC